MRRLMEDQHRIHAARQDVDDARGSFHLGRLREQRVQALGEHVRAQQQQRKGLLESLGRLLARIDQRSGVVDQHVDGLTPGQQAGCEGLDVTQEAQLGNLDPDLVVAGAAPEFPSDALALAGIAYDQGQPCPAPREDARRPFTLVLKGMIRVSMARWPKGVAGRDLDALARNALWQAGLDYDHGTGHGVGAYLNGFEGTLDKIDLARARGAGGIVLFSYDWAVGTAPGEDDEPFLQRVAQERFRPVP